MAAASMKEVRANFNKIAAKLDDKLSVLLTIGMYNDFSGLSKAEEERTSYSASNKGSVFIPYDRPGIVNFLTSPNQDISNLIGDRETLATRMTINTHPNAAFSMTDYELRDLLTYDRLKNSSIEAMASAINKSVMEKIVEQSTLCVKRTAAPTGFDDIVQIDNIFDTTQVSAGPMDRFVAAPTQDYNAFIGGFLNGKQYIDRENVEPGIRDLILGRVANTNVFKTGVSPDDLVAASATGVTLNTLSTGPNNYVPVGAKDFGGTLVEQDAKWQTVTVNSTTGIKPKDCFVVAGVYDVAPRTKTSTGTLKQQKVVSVIDGTTMVISPGFITNRGSTANFTTKEWQNCLVTAEAAAAPVTFLNTVTRPPTIFWARDAVKLWPTAGMLPDDTGVLIAEAILPKTGIQVQVVRWTHGPTKTSYTRIDCSYGVNVVAPSQCGVMLFNQT